jgi:anhydro-N-acetylmuramic acid kinase
MSGSSLDGLDVAYCRFQILPGSRQFEIIDATTYPYSLSIKKSLQKIHLLDSKEFVELDTNLGEFMGKIVNQFIQEKKIKKVDYIASHGHTAYHNPDKNYTSQIGNGAVIAAQTDIPAISDFRRLDVALGGQGAPLVPIGDKLLFQKYTYCLNLGGYSNISFDNLNQQRIAFDICPVNKVINSLANEIGKEYDYNGEIAKYGKVNEALLKDLNSLSYYTQDYPKSLGDHWLMDNFMPLLKKSSISTPDKLRTVYEHIAIQIGRATSDTTNKSILTTGGGAHNKFLIECIKSHNYNSIVLPGKILIDFKEALIFAFMGVLRAENSINCLSSVTGARKDSSGGVIHHV